jgi:hypothetical protein
MAPIASKAPQQRIAGHRKDKKEVKKCKTLNTAGDVLGATKYRSQNGTGLHGSSHGFCDLRK